MDRLIKSVPIIVIASFLGYFFQSGDSEFSNLESASFCALMVFMLTALLYIFRKPLRLAITNPGKYMFFMIAAALLTYGVLYASLEYFYN